MYLKLSRIIVFFILPLLMAGTAMAQERVEFKGVVYRSDNNERLPFANVISVKQKTGVPTDELGKFRILVAIGDTIRFTHLGFDDTIIPVNEESLEMRDNLLVKISPRVYELSQITVRNLRDLPGFIQREEDRKQLAIIGLPNRPPLVRDPLNYYKSSIGFGTGGGGLGGGVALTGLLTALFSNFDNHYKQLKKLEILKAQERQQKAVQKLYDDKFSEEIVGPIVKLEGAELSAFMERYKPHPVFLTMANDYDLTEYLLEKLESYKRLKRGQR